MDARRTESQIQEQLVSLYLRLNGFFVTSFIVHSPTHGRFATEVDALALRMPLHAEPERMIATDPLLDLSDQYTELCLCEVKSKNQALQFNKAQYKNQDAIATILRWAELFRSEEVADLAKLLAVAMAPKSQTYRSPPTVIGPRYVRIRGLSFSPERNESRRENQPWFVSGPDVFQYIRSCLCPPVPRPSCATRYDVHAWGEHEQVVRYFKSRQADEPLSMQSLYAYMHSSDRNPTGASPQTTVG